MLKIILYCLLVSSTICFANNSSNIILPEKSNLYFLGIDNESGAYLFDGEIMLKDILEAGWVYNGVNNDGEIQHNLELHFFPQ